MIHIENFLDQLQHIFENPILMLGIFSTAILIKILVLVTLIKKKSPSLISKYPYLFLLGVLITSMLQDFEWVFTSLNKIFLDDNEINFFIFWGRCAWAFTVLFYQFLALFMESLVSHEFKFNFRNKLFISISIIISLFFPLNALFDYNYSIPNESIFLIIRNLVRKFTSFYAPFALLLTSLFFTYQTIQSNQLPRILRKQVKLLLAFAILPFWVTDFMQIGPFIFSLNLSWINTGYLFLSLSNILITSAIFYCSRRMLGLRFLNWSSQVQSPVNINFMEQFKTILDQFSQITSLRELNHITQRFFKESFDIPFNRIRLQLRTSRDQFTRQEDDDNQTALLVENFLSTHSDEVCTYIKNHKILVYDELAFSNFYESTPESRACLTFLDSIQADIFLPVYEKDKMIAYITIDRYARLKEFYTNTEYDQMLIFTRYLGNIINLMQNKNLDILIKQEKELQEELYSKHQEISQYKESIRSFLRNTQHKDIGIIFYKNRRFTFGNKAARDLIKTNPNVQEGHPLSKALKQLAQQIESYKTAQTMYVKDTDGTKLVLSGVPSLEQNNIIISVYYPEVTDIIKKQIDILKDPSEWDYLLYLETTKPGKLINQLIPGSGETLLNFKIELLKTALSKKATLLDMPEQDLLQTAELLHHISLRETLHTLDLSQQKNSAQIAITLFGINALFNGGKESAKPLLERLDNIGTLFIKQIHLLDLESQQYLAEFIRYGFFRVFKSDTKISSNVRIICSTNQNLQLLVSQGKFSPELFAELKQTTLTMPSLMTLPEEELGMLADGFSEQAVANQTYKNLLTLSDKDKHRLAFQRPASLQEMKTKIQQILVQKSKQNDIYQETQFDPAYSVSDPELLHAARLGKKALKDEKTMILLWNKFKNQNKIAAFLGVNRSSVNRRCRQFDLIEE